MLANVSLAVANEKLAILRRQFGLLVQGREELFLPWGFGGSDRKG